MTDYTKDANELIVQEIDANATRALSSIMISKTFLAKKLADFASLKVSKAIERKNEEIELLKIEIRQLVADKETPF